MNVVKKSEDEDKDDQDDESVSDKAKKLAQQTAIDETNNSLAKSLGGSTSNTTSHPEVPDSLFTRLRILIGYVQICATLDIAFEIQWSSYSLQDRSPIYAHYFAQRCVMQNRRHTIKQLLESQTSRVEALAHSVSFYIYIGWEKYEYCKCQLQIISSL